MQLKMTTTACFIWTALFGVALVTADVDLHISGPLKSLLDDLFEKPGAVDTQMLGHKMYVYGDMNQDGIVEMEEYIKYVQKAVAYLENKALAKVPIQHREEAKLSIMVGMKEMGIVWEEQFNNADLNGDGILDGEELGVTAAADDGPPMPKHDEH